MILLDTDVLIDVALGRRPHSGPAPDMPAQGLFVFRETCPSTAQRPPPSIGEGGVRVIDNATAP